MQNFRPYCSAACRTFAAIASRVGPSPPVGLNRCSATVSQPFCCIHWKCVFTVCWSYDENSRATCPFPRSAYAVWYGGEE
ncbi:hypothetical protein EV651_12580 [Kribbella sp. VKM Ac-2571]|uniref:hypothetical protein n=1 Tax=Kribbella sp. VKM Ac-2571 TaxID=2512222 RepID=UPI0010D35689|nr:hypothetical protein [Kribbella sp. VKM Ac-2571]TDO47086.1 hypothetical protein EV651_12580 [Kribbella sp. VKM Ac-2571]